MEDFTKFVDGIKWERSSYDYKRGTLYIKILDLITKIYRSSQKTPQEKAIKWFRILKFYKNQNSCHLLAFLAKF